MSNHYSRERQDKSAFLLFLFLHNCTQSLFVFLQFIPLISCRLCVPSASAHQRLLLVPAAWHPLHGGQRGEKETPAQGGYSQIRSLTVVSPQHNFHEPRHSYPARLSHIFLIRGSLYSGLK